MQGTTFPILLALLEQHVQSYEIFPSNERWGIHRVKRTSLGTVIEGVAAASCMSIHCLYISKRSC